MDDRIRKNLTAGRESRATQDRKGDNAALASGKSRNRRFQNEFTQQVLPDVTGDPSWHYCWLSTTNQYDTIHSRLRMGYVAVNADEIPGFEHLKVKEGEHVGHVSCNEMLLYKLPMDVYQDYMAEMHHYRPMDEATKVKVQQEQLMGSVKDSRGRPLVVQEGDGMDVMETPPPVFEYQLPFQVF